MCGSTETLLSVEMFYGVLNTTEREIYSGKKYKVLFWSAKRKIQRTGERQGESPSSKNCDIFRIWLQKKSSFFHMGHDVFC
jgi:hypothetical protein